MVRSRPTIPCFVPLDPKHEKDVYRNPQIGTAPFAFRPRFLKKANLWLVDPLDIEHVRLRARPDVK